MENGCCLVGCWPNTCLLRGIPRSPVTNCLVPECTGSSTLGGSHSNGAADPGLPVPPYCVRAHTLPGCIAWVLLGFGSVGAAMLCPLWEGKLLNRSFVPYSLMAWLLKLARQESTAQDGVWGAFSTLDVSSVHKLSPWVEAPWKATPLWTLQCKERTFMSLQIFVSRQNSSVS